jgi:hypothetical protein
MAYLAASCSSVVSSRETNNHIKTQFGLGYDESPKLLGCVILEKGVTIQPNKKKNKASIYSMTLQSSTLPGLQTIKI